MSDAVPSILFQTDRQTSAVCKRAPVVPPELLVSQPTIIAAALLCDALAIFAVGAATFGALPLRANGADPALLVLAPAGVIIGVLAILGARWAYTIRALSSATRQAFELARALLLSLASFIVCDALSGAYAPEQRAWLLHWFLYAWALCVAARFVFAGLLAHWTREGRLARRAVIVGGGDDASQLIQRLDRTANGTIQILGLFDDRDNPRSPEQVGAYCKLGRFDDLVEFCRAQRRSPDRRAAAERRGAHIATA